MKQFLKNYANGLQDMLAIVLLFVCAFVLFISITYLLLMIQSILVLILTVVAMLLAIPLVVEIYDYFGG